MTIEEIKQTIEKLKQVDLDTESREKLMKEMLQGVPFWMQWVRQINEDQDGERKFFRAQRGLHNTVERMWAPEEGADYIVIGRANYEKESVLYCTDEDFYSCILEIVDRKTSEEQTITVIEFKNNTDFVIVPVGLIDREAYTQQIKKSGVKFSETEYEKYKIVSEFIDNEFRMKTGDDDRDYLNSSILSKIVRNEFKKAIGIRYKTVQGFKFSHNGLNYALTTDKLDETFTVDKAIQYRFKWNENDTYQFQPIDSATGSIDKEGEITYDKNINTATNN